jgi:general secretion pathway protein A
LYLQYFGLRETPFALTPDPKYFYGSELHREALAVLYYGIESKKGFVVVTGEVGTGKTTLLRKLRCNLKANHHSVFIFNAPLTFDELLETILRDLAIHRQGAGRVATLEALNGFLLEKIRVGHVVSVLIDEAHNLTEDVLEGIRLLSNMETDREKLIQVILVGQTELEAKLNRPSLRQLKQRVPLWSRLDCLSPADTERYIRHRLEVAGYRGPELFDPSSLELIGEHAAGTPRLINSICDNALLTCFAGSEKVVTAEIIHEVARDLCLTRPSASLNVTLPERSAIQQIPPGTIWDLPETLDDGVRMKSRLPEEPTDRLQPLNGIALPRAADVVHNLLTLKLCPSCANSIDEKVTKCPYCKAELTSAELPEQLNRDEASPRPRLGYRDKRLSLGSKFIWPGVMLVVTVVAFFAGGYKQRAASLPSTQVELSQLQAKEQIIRSQEAQLAELRQQFNRKAEQLAELKTQFEDRQKELSRTQQRLRVATRQVDRLNASPSAFARRTVARAPTAAASPSSATPITTADPGVYQTTRGTPVYEKPSAASPVIAHIEPGIRINVIGSTGAWLEVHSKHGNPPGFIQSADARPVGRVN